MQNNEADANMPTAVEQADATRWRLIGEGDWLDGQVFLIGERAVLGRDASCDIIIPGKHLSRRHAEILVKGERLLVRDLGSANGTFVNDERITEREVTSGEVVRFDVLRFRVQGPARRDKAHTRLRERASSSTQAATSDGQDKRWVTKPTSVGNRHKTESFRLQKRTGNLFWPLMAMLLVSIAVAAWYYLWQRI